MNDKKELKDDQKNEIKIIEKNDEQKNEIKIIEKNDENENELKLFQQFLLNSKRIPKENETKEIKVKLKTTKKELSGISIELLGIGKDEISEIYNLNSEIYKNSEIILSCIINGKDINSTNEIKTCLIFIKKDWRIF